jgi:pyruvate kinase
MLGLRVALGRQLGVCRSVGVLAALGQRVTDQQQLHDERDYAPMTRRTKIVATIGPASETPRQLEALMRAGVDVVRLNLSHGPIEEHLERLDRVRAASARVGKPGGVLADLPGPKIRAGAFPAGGVHLSAGADIVLRPGDEPSDDEVVHVDYPTLLDDVHVGDRLSIGDGAITLRCTAVATDQLRATIETGDRTQGRPGVHISSEKMRMTTPTATDLVLAETVAAAGVDFVAVSFVCKPDDMRAVRAVVGDRAKLVAKIETSAALANLQGIIRESDAIMVARGDLGIDCPLEDLPHLQKSIVRQCIEYGIPVITATQMLESMITAPSPTRAEVTDVANAVFDGTDALMLSGETAIGNDPVLTVATMHRIAARAEVEASYRQWAARLGRIQRETWSSKDDRITAALTHAASEAAVDLDVAGIVCCTNSGRTATAMARFRPVSRLVALSPNPRTVTQLTLSWGVETLGVDTYDSSDEIVWFSVERAVQHGLFSSGDTIVVLAGSPVKSDDIATDVLRVVQVS